MFVNPSGVTKWFMRIFSWPSQGQGQGQMSNTSKYCLEFLFTTYDITIVNETTQLIHIVVHLDILQGNKMKFRLKILLGCHGNEDFNFKFYIFTIYNMRMSMCESCLSRMQMN